MRHLAALLLLAVSAVPALAQWQVFAEKLPKPGTWATYRMETTKAGQQTTSATLRFSVQPGREVDGQPPSM